MHALIDKKTPKEIKRNLNNLCPILEFETEDIVYPAISGHPDIFFCQNTQTLICAKNTPVKFLETLSKNNINYIKGKTNLKQKYPLTAHYNAVIIDDILIHNTKHTDDKIKETIKTEINIKQGYTRCNLLMLPDKSFFTSDRNIYLTLRDFTSNTDDKNIFSNGIYIDPKQIILPQHNHGFIGGTCGLFEDTILFAGSLKYLKDGKLLYNFLTDNGYKIVELANTPLFDCGSILFI